MLRPHLPALHVQLEAHAMAQLRQRALVRDAQRVHVLHLQASAKTGRIAQVSQTSALAVKR